MPQSPSPNMNLILPTPTSALGVGGDNGPLWANELNTALGTVVDLHDHSTGKGVPLTNPSQNFGTPVNPTDVATKAYADSEPFILTAGFSAMIDTTSQGQCLVFGYLPTSIVPTAFVKFSPPMAMVIRSITYTSRTGVTLSGGTFTLTITNVSTSQSLVVGGPNGFVSGSTTGALSVSAFDELSITITWTGTLTTGPTYGCLMFGCTKA